MSCTQEATQDAGGAESDSWSGSGSERGEEEDKGWGLLVATRPGLPNHKLTEAVVQFGRRSKCQVRHDEPTISGMHCRLERREGGLVWLTDTSTNGTYLGATRLKRGEAVLVGHGTELTLIPTHGKHRRLSYILYVHAQAPRRAEYDESTAEGAYDFREELGRGAFATVYLAIHRRTGERVAVKKMDKHRLNMNVQSSRGQIERAEVDILRRLDHPNIIKVMEVYETPAHLYIVLELVSGGDLFDQIVGYGRPYPEARARHIFKQILSAVAYLHTNGIVHRDLKPENVLLKAAVPPQETRHDRDVVKIADFGFSRFVGETSFMKTLCGTPMYIAPEVLRPAAGQPGYHKAADLWSIGVILFILLSAHPPFDDQLNLPDQVLRGAVQYTGSAWTRVSAEARDLVERLLTVDPAERIDIDGCFAHAWVRGEEGEAAAGAAAAAPAAASSGAAAAAAAAAAPEEKAQEKEQVSPATKRKAPDSGAMHQRNGAGMSQVYGIFDEDGAEAGDGGGGGGDGSPDEPPPSKRARGAGS